MTVDEIITRLRAEPNRVTVAKATGMDYMYLSRLAWGKMKRPGSDKIDTLRTYYLSRDVQQSPR